MDLYKRHLFIVSISNKIFKCNQTWLKIYGVISLQSDWRLRVLCVTVFLIFCRDCFRCLRSDDLHGICQRSHVLQLIYCVIGDTLLHDVE